MNDVFHEFNVPYGFFCTCRFTLEGDEPAIMDIKCQPVRWLDTREKFLASLIDWESDKVIQTAIDFVLKSKEYQFFVAQCKQLQEAAA